ncbi:MAG: hypothetical protein NC086_04855 [Alistipes sp.]|nr:hypothetical protein [Alistipes sp.]
MVKDFVKKNSVYCILAVMILLQTAQIIYCFEVKKKDFHSDEIWSYGPANSYEMGYFYSQDPAQNVLSHYHEWVPGEELDSYMTVRKGERFAYGMIYKTIAKDLHQPVYYWLLHTICSFFPDVFSWWFGFGLNLIFFIGSQILLFLFVRRITGNEFLALFVCFVYGFNQGAVDTYIYIRMYSMITFLGLLTCYLHTLLWENGANMKKILPAICGVTLIGGLTHVYFYVFACAVSACFCFYYLFQKKWKRLFGYAGAMLGAVVVSFVIYPYTITHSLLYTEQNMQSTKVGYGGFWFELRYLKSFIAKELAGIELSVMPSYFLIHFAEVMIIGVTVLVPLVFLLRNEPWFRKGGVKTLAGAKKILYALKKRTNLMVLVSLFVVLVNVGATAAVSRPLVMGQPATRYVFHIYPYLFFVMLYAGYGVVVLLCRGIFFVIKKEPENCRKAEKTLCCLLACAFLVFSCRYSAKAFYFDYDIDFYLNEMPREANYILQLKADDRWLLDSVSNSLYGIENIFPVVQETALEYEEELEALNSDSPVYLILQIPKWKEMIGDTGEEQTVELDSEFAEMLVDMTNVEDERVKNFLSPYQEFYSKLDISEEFTYIGLSEIFGRNMFVFRLRS